MRNTLILVTALAALAGARIIYVPDSVSTIQGGIAAAANGDTVLLSPGTYNEVVSLQGKLVTLASRFILSGDTAMISATVIDANQAGTVVTCSSGEDTTACIVGLTLRNGRVGNGGGIYCDGGSPSIRYNIIEDNYSVNDGAGVMVMGQSAPIIEHNVIRRNNTGIWGGGIYIFDGSSPRVRRNLIYSNGSMSQAGFSPAREPAVVAGRLVEPGRNPGPFAENGGGILVTNFTGLITRPVIHHNTIYGNEAYDAGGGVYSNRAEPDIRNNIVASNQNYGIYSEVTALACPYNDIWNNSSNYGGAASAGTGAISANPVFADSAGRDFHILSGSPCIDAGDPSLPKDPDSTRADIGAFWWNGTGVAAPRPEPVLRPLRVCPNPFAGSAAVEPGRAVMVRDAAGRLVERSENGRFGAALAPGVYFVESAGCGRAKSVKLGSR